jgi:hypothetical protein
MSSELHSTLRDYIVISDSDIRILESKVMAKIKDGFVPAGGISSGATTYEIFGQKTMTRVEYHQAMIRNHEYYD